MFGILNINKPAGWTSRDVVNRVQRLVRPAKVGHAGTLDPLATGVLVVCVGAATRLINFVQQMPKTYRATFLLGRSSPSEDTETEITELRDATQPTLAQLEATLPRFVGAIQQRPPAYSALKVGGKRAYAMARKGEVVTLKSRTIEVYQLEIDQYDYPTLNLHVRCGSGTYIRSLGRDLAEAVGSAAVMSSLERTAIGRFAVEEAIEIETLDAQSLEASLLPALDAVGHLPVVVLDDAQVVEVRHGRFVAKSPSIEVTNEQFVATDKAGSLIAILQEKPGGMWGPVRVFPPSA